MELRLRATYRPRSWLVRASSPGSCNSNSSVGPHIPEGASVPATREPQRRTQHLWWLRVRCRRCQLEMVPAAVSHNRVYPCPFLQMPLVSDVKTLNMEPSTALGSIRRFCKLVVFVPHPCSRRQDVGGCLCKTGFGDVILFKGHRVRNSRHGLYVPVWGATQICYEPCG